MSLLGSRSRPESHLLYHCPAPSMTRSFSTQSGSTDLCWRPSGACLRWLQGSEVQAAPAGLLLLRRRACFRQRWLWNDSVPKAEPSGLGCPTHPWLTHSQVLPEPGAAACSSALIGLRSPSWWYCPFNQPREKVFPYSKVIAS